MIYVLLALTIIVLYLALCVRKLNDNFATWATRDIRRRGLK